MLQKFGERFSESYQRIMPDAFVFAIILTLVTFLAAVLTTEATVLQTLEAWYQGFWMLLEFGMQMVLILVTGYSVALAPSVNRLLQQLTNLIEKPELVYPFIVVIGFLFSLISWGWVVITAVLAREIALRVKGLNYPFLIAAVYFSGMVWVNGFSSSIPLLLNTSDNYLIESGILDSTIGTDLTIGSFMSIATVFIVLVTGPLIFWILKPKKPLGLPELLSHTEAGKEISIGDEAQGSLLGIDAWSDRLNNGVWLQLLVVAAGFSYIFYHFYARGFDIDLNIMIFIFVILGLLLHKTPLRYGIAMKRSSSNISAILFQYPFYAGIMGIMMYTGLGEQIAVWMAEKSSLHTYPIFAYLTGAIVNFAIPSAGGEFAVVGPSILSAVKEIGAGLPPELVTEMLARASMAVAYGETLTNQLQPFFLLVVLPVMGKGTQLQARDVMGYLLIPFIFHFVLLAAIVTLLPMSLAG